MNKQNIYSVFGMTCVACSSRVQNAVSKVDGVTQCQVNLLTNSMEVEGDATSEQIISAVQHAGYDAQIKGAKHSAKTQMKDNSEMSVQNHAKRLIWSSFFLIILMYFGMFHSMFGSPLPAVLSNNIMAVGFIQMLLAGVILVINQRFFINGAKGIMHLSPNMDSLVSLGSGISFCYSVVILFLLIVGKNVSPDFYFESSAMILVFITVGKLLEATAKNRTTSALTSLMNLTPQNAVVLDNGVEKIVPIDDICVGDTVLVRPGENIPVDGKVSVGNTSVNESALTGESMSVSKQIGDKVFAGTVNLDGVIQVRAEKVAGETTLAKIIDMVESASAGKAPVAKIADKVSGVFVPIVTAIAFITAVIWLLLGESVGFALARGICVLVISCPCALGLATPVAIMVGNGVAAKNNILFKTAESLEGTSKAKIIVLDKTGTITEGKPEVTNIISFDKSFAESDILRIAYSLELNSNHPLSSAIKDKSEKLSVKNENVSEVREVAGMGVSANVNGQNVKVGRVDFFADKSLVVGDIPIGQMAIFIGINEKIVGMITFSDKIKDNSKTAVEQLRKMGLLVYVLSGDNEETVKNVSNEINANGYFAGIMPNQKAEIVKDLQQKGKVIMVGDGINDAVALTAADIGMAIGTGTDIAKDAAEVVLVGHSLQNVVNAINISRKVLKNIYENLFWAFFYNCLGIPVAAGALHSFGITLTPAIGALAMSLSSFCVVTNALRLNMIKIIKSNKTFCENKTKETKMTKTIKIEGMMCGHCEARVKKVLEELDGVTSAQVSHEKGTAVIEMSKEISNDILKSTIEAQDYTVTGIE